MKRWVIIPLAVSLLIAGLLWSATKEQSVEPSIVCGDDQGWIDHMSSVNEKVKKQELKIAELESELASVRRDFRNYRFAKGGINITEDALVCSRELAKAVSNIDALDRQMEKYHQEKNSLQTRLKTCAANSDVLHSQLVEIKMQYNAAQSVGLLASKNCNEEKGE